MRKTYGVISLLLLISIIIPGYAQRIVQGTVRTTSGKEGLPGVTVVVKGTKIGTSTNGQGEFQLISLRDTIALVFSSVGFETLEKKITITQNTTIVFPIRLKEECIIDFFYHKHIELSVLSGLRYTPLGGRVKIFYPYLIHVRHSQGALRAEFSYQLGKDNYQRNGTLALDNAFINCDNNVDVISDYQCVKLGRQAFSYTRYTVGAMYTGSRAIPVYVGVGKLNCSMEGINTINAGVEAGINYPFSIYFNSSHTASLQIVTTGRVAWWQDYWQFRSSLETEFNRFSLGVNFNKLNHYTEVNTRIGFKLERRYHAKKLSN